MDDCRVRQPPPGSAAFSGSSSHSYPCVIPRAEDDERRPWKSQRDLCGVAAVAGAEEFKLAPRRATKAKSPNAVPEALTEEHESALAPICKFPNETICYMADNMSISQYCKQNGEFLFILGARNTIARATDAPSCRRRSASTSSFAVHERRRCRSASA